MRKSRLLLPLALSSFAVVGVVACGDGTSSGDPGLDDGGAFDGATSDSATNDSATDGGADAVGATTASAYSISVTVKGLAGSGLVLQNNGGDDLAVTAANPTADVKASFKTKLEGGKGYAVTIKSQPSAPNQKCTVSGDKGTVVAGDVSSIVVNCTNAFAIGGTVSGLAGAGLTLQNNAGDDLPINTNGKFAFSALAVTGDGYAVTIKTQPTDPGQTCAVTTGSGVVAAADIDSVDVVCTTNKYAIGGTITGLVGSGAVIQNNGGDDIALAAGATSFTFPVPVESGGNYAVTVKTQPSGPAQTCTVSSGGPTPVGDTDVSNVAIVCATNKYQVKVNVSGLSGTAVLQNNGLDDLSVSANGVVPFATTIESGQPYAVTLKSNSTAQGELCGLRAPSSGTIGAADVTVDLVCSKFAVLNGTPDPATVLNTIEVTFGYPNNLVNGIWHKPSNQIIVGDYSASGYWMHSAAAGGYSATPDHDTGTVYSRMVHMPATETVVRTDQKQFPAAYNHIYVGTIDGVSGAIGGFATAVFSDGFTGQCNLLSSSASEFLCFDGAKVRHYATTKGSPNLTFVKTVSVAPTFIADSYSFGGTFAWDGMFYYFSSGGNSPFNLGYEVFDAAGALHGTYTATGSGAIDGIYFDWSVGRYAIHDGYGGRIGGTRFSSAGGSDSDTQAYGVVSAAHIVP